MWSDLIVKISPISIKYLKILILNYFHVVSLRHMMFNKQEKFYLHNK